MRLVRQKPNGCGLACVAMLAGVTLARAEAAVGKTRKTHTRDLLRGLRRLGFRPAPRLQRLTPDIVPPMRCVLKVRWRGTRDTHWVVHDRGGWVYCPAHGVLALADLRRRADVLSFLRVRAGA